MYVYDMAFFQFISTNITVNKIIEDWTQKYLKKKTKYFVFWCILENLVCDLGEEYKMSRKWHFQGS